MTQKWSSILSDAISIRHALHRKPELTWQEQQTAAYVRDQLSQLDIPWRICAKHGTVGTLAHKATGKHIALRADIDALPIEELVDLPYRSEHDGCMHACGHDGHTAALWAAAAWLKEHEDQLPGPVSLLFQPAEEGGHGAKKMIEDGALDSVDVIYGWHNWPAIPFGQAVCPDGPVMSGNGTFEIEVLGIGGHSSQPEVCRDPVLAAAAITLNLQQVVSRRFAPQSPVVLSVCSFDAKSQHTVTPEKAVLAGSFRISQAELREPITQLIEQITLDTARTYGVEAKVHISQHYQTTNNHANAAKNYREALEQEYGSNWKAETLPTPIMASEDFSYYLKEIPGAFALIGMNKDAEFQHSCHSPHYQFNDDLLEPVVRIFARLVGAPLPKSD